VRKGGSGERGEGRKEGRREGEGEKGKRGRKERGEGREGGIIYIFATALFDSWHSCDLP